jgi:hypothetical protein
MANAKKISTCQGSEDLAIRKKPAAEVVTARRAAKLLAEQHADSAAQIGVRRYEFKSLEDGRAIVYSDDSGAAVVTEVNHDRTLLSTCVLPGYIVSGVQVTGIVVTDVMGAQAIIDLVGTIVLDPANHRCKTFCSYRCLCADWLGKGSASQHTSNELPLRSLS